VSKTFNTINSSLRHMIYTYIERIIQSVDIISSVINMVRLVILDCVMFKRSKPSKTSPHPSYCLQ